MNLSDKEAKEIVESLNFKEGLITAIVRDRKDKEILMIAFMNPEAALKTLKTGEMHFWSREREKLWRKGEESGNKQVVKEVKVDCDKDSLLFEVEPKGPACHKGYRSCFYRKVDGDSFTKIMERVFDPEEVYG